jgi:hypothetical protein
MTLPMLGSDAGRSELLTDSLCTPVLEDAATPSSLERPGIEPGVASSRKHRHRTTGF